MLGFTRFVRIYQRYRPVLRLEGQRHPSEAGLAGGYHRRSGVLGSGIDRLSHQRQGWLHVNGSSLTTRGAALGSAGLLLGAVLLSGCAGSADSDSKDSDNGQKTSSDSPKRQSPAEAVQATDKKTSKAGTADIEMTVTTSGAQGKSVTGEGVIDLRDGTSEITLQQGQERIDQRVVDQTLYQQLPKKAASQLPDGKSWMKVDLKEIKTRGGAGLNNPADSLGYTEALSEKDVEKLGTEQIDGTRTTHYRVQLDLEELAKGDAAQQKKLRKQLGDDVPVELWIDDKGVTRRQQVELTAQPSGREGGEKQKVKTTIELSDFGTEVDVQPPPAEKTADMTDKVAREAARSS
ncbi:LppX_LprAFG lipoprotein [Streptomyces sp. B15]|nr:LppX_LprAFG lipoprotein [Streptomyces sp. B15]